MIRRRFSIGILSVLFLLSSLNLTLPANAIMNGQVVLNSSRVVPIFLLENENAPQPTNTVAFTGFLYSSRIVFTAIPDFGFDGTGNQFKRNFGAIYVGKPGSDISDIEGRVKVIKRFNSKQFRFESSQLDEFGILVLEKDLINANPYPLLTEDKERELAQSAQITGYGEYRDHCPPGKKPPCREKLFEPSSKPRTVNVSIFTQTRIEAVVGYKQPQLRNQYFFYNQANPQAGAVCFGDQGAPIIGEYRLKGIYIGQMSSAVRIYGCGRGVDYDGKGGIHYASPVYKHLGLIREAEAFVDAEKKATMQPEEDLSSIIPSGQSVVSLKTTKSYEHDNEKVQVNYTGDVNHLKSKPTGFRFFNGYEGTLLQVSQISLANADCTNPSITQLDCTFPNFNPYKNILIKNKKQGVTLQVAPYNNAGQGPISPGVNMHEPVWTSRFASIDFVDSEKVIKDIYGTNLGSFNLGGLRSKSTESKAKLRFVFQGPRLPKGVAPKITFTKDKNSQKSKKYRMKLAGYKYQDEMHQFDYESSEKVKFTGDSKFYAEFEIVDELGFRRGGTSDFFTYGYNMNWVCSSLGLSSTFVRSTTKLSYATALGAFSMANILDELPAADKLGKVQFLKKFFRSPETILGWGLRAIEASEAPGGINFKIYLQEEAKAIGKELTESFAKQVIRQSSFATPGAVPVTTYNMLVTVEDGIYLVYDYFRQVDDWNQQNAELITEICAKS